MTPPNAQNNNKTGNVGDTAPHRIVNWVSMQDTVNSNLAKCKTCKTKGMKLVEQKRISLASTFELECETCHTRADKVRQQVYYLQREYEYMKSREAYVELANLKAKLKKVQAALDVKRVHPIPNKKFKGKKGNHLYTLEYEINIRGMMAAFYIGTGGYDIGELIGMFGLPGGKVGGVSFTNIAHS